MATQADAEAWLKQHCGTFGNVRWALQDEAEVMLFEGAAAREKWLKANPGRRRAVGKRHPAVKAFRRQVSDSTNI